MSEFDRYYEVLEIAPGAPVAAVKQAYRTLARRWHPDRFTSLEDKAIAEAKFKQINLAYEQLKDYVPPVRPPRSSPSRSPQSKSSGRSPQPTTPPSAAAPPPRSPQVPTRGKSPQRLYQMAADYAREGKYEAAIACLGVAIGRQPDYAIAYRYRGHLRSLLSLERSAAADLRKADKLERPASRPANSVPVAVPPAAMAQ
ncbi:J domain-containing protein, partial [filamentous cyanobacterium LEGE 11480]